MEVLLVDDHPLIHEIMNAVLRRSIAPAVVHREKDLESALAHGRRLKRIGLAVLDLKLPGCSGIEALTRFRVAFPKVPVVIVSAIEDGHVVRAAIAAGAKGYIPKTSSIDVMQSALRLVASGGTYVPQEALQYGRRHAPAARSGISTLGLSNRQIDVLKCVVRGWQNQQIAKELAISENTVKHHVHEVLRALGVATRTEAIVAAVRRGLRPD